MKAFYVGMPISLIARVEMSRGSRTPVCAISMIFLARSSASGSSRSTMPMVLSACS
jgi:hypothetical protein